ncbi:MAG: RidA family protein [Syntrophomonadaceae bacterium]|jgi:2-iminobutanoate/2-iminopropanoate deaminase|nr:RidA family protein [Syntrophomonadaceae bacterium]
MKIISAASAPAAIGPYSQAVVNHGLVYTSGQIPLVPETGDIAEGSIKEQTSQVLKNLAALLTASGSGLSRVIKTTCFLTNMEDFNDFNEIYAGFFADHRPARSCVAVAALPKGALVEIEAIAAVND